MTRTDELTKMYSVLESQDKEGAELAYNIINTLYAKTTATPETKEQKKAEELKEQKAKEEAKAERDTRLCIKHLPNNTDEYKDLVTEAKAIVDSISTDKLLYFVSFMKYKIDMEMGQEYSRYIQDRIDKAILKKNKRKASTV